MANPTALTCSQVDDYLANNDSMFGAWIHEALKETSPWYALVPKEAFPEGRGYTQRDITIEGMTSGSAEDDWTAVTQSDGSTTNPLSAPDFTDLAWGQTYTNWSPYYKGYKTPCIALDDLRFDHLAAQQLMKTFEKLREVTDEVLSNRFRYEYARLVPQITARPGFGAGIAGTTDTTQMVKVATPTSVITQSILDTAYDYLLRTGAGVDPESRSSLADGAPVFTFITSRGTSDNIIHSANIRDDYRYGDPGALLKPLGVTRTFRGFSHVVDVELPRFNLVENVMTRVMPWTTTAASSGTKRIINPSYLTADYELNYIFVRSAMSCAVIKDVSSKTIDGATFEDKPEYYTGQFIWHNQKDNTSNLLGKLGRWLGIFANATHPGTPSRGLTILSKRCNNDQTFSGCSCS